MRQTVPAPIPRQATIHAHAIRRLVLWHLGVGALILAIALLS